MGAVLTIAKRDLRSFFANPRGVVIFGFFLFLLGFFFQSFLGTFMQMQQQAAMMQGGQTPTLDELLKALFYNVHFILIFIIPLVTMASFAEEHKSKSLRLLTTAPVTALQIVLGKFFACAGLMALVLAASFVYPGFSMKYGNPDTAIILSSYLGIYLLACSQVAFGLWISSMTTSPMIAAFLTIFGLFMLLILNFIAPNLTGGGSMEEFVKYLATSPHLDNFLKGLITVKDVVYFLCFISMFLFFTNAVIDSQRWR